MAAFDDEIQNEWIGVRFFCTMDGIGKVFLDGPWLRGHSKVVGGQPTSSGLQYEIQE